MVAMEGAGGVEGARWYDQQASHNLHTASRLNPHQEDVQVPSPYFPGAYHGYSSAMNHGMHFAAPCSDAIGALCFSNLADSLFAHSRVFIQHFSLHIDPLDQICLA